MVIKVCSCDNIPLCSMVLDMGYFATDMCEYRYVRIGSVNNITIKLVNRVHRVWTGSNGISIVIQRNCNSNPTVIQ